LPLDVFALASKAFEASSLVTCLAATALPFFAPGLCPTIAERDSEVREGGRECLVST
jgi:hypothetical protein